MFLPVLCLLLSTLLGGWYVEKQFTYSTKVMALLLTFSGSYLLAITLIHLVPDLFHDVENPMQVSICVMCGFFMQHFFEMTSAGIAHGHGLVGQVQSVKPFKIIPFVLSIMIHALLDGVILMQGTLGHKSSIQWSIVVWLGILLHKFLESFAFMLVLKQYVKRYRIGYLCIFALAAPIGLWLSSYIGAYCSCKVSKLFVALITGNFMYISSTMLFESSPEHSHKPAHVWVSMLGAAIATVVEVACSALEKYGSI